MPLIEEIVDEPKKTEMPKATDEMKDFPFSPKMLEALMNPKNPSGALRSIISLGNPDLLEPMLEKVDMLKAGPELMQTAVVQGKADIVQCLLKKGADVYSPPDRAEGDASYRKTPYSMLAAQSGDVDTLELVLKVGGSLQNTGVVCLSKRRKNMVTSNIVACAAYYGKKKVLQKVLPRVAKSFLEHGATEQRDTMAAQTSAYQKEFQNYTPLMLCAARSDENLDCLKVLLQAGADFNCKDDFGNTVLHVAALNGNNKIIDYLAKNLKINIFERNTKGETATNICGTLANADGVKILEQYQNEYDTSKAKAQDLLDELCKEEDQSEEAKAKRRQKKWRNKINRIAKAEGLTTEQVEERLAREDEQKKADEAQKKKDEEERERREQLEAAARKVELRKQREELRRQEELEEEAERRRVDAEEREARDARRAAQAEKRERYKSAGRQSRPEQVQEEKPSLKKERVKSVRRTAPETERGERQSRQQAHESGPTATARKSSKSVRRALDEMHVENKIAGDEGESSGVKKIYGLGLEMALSAATSKKAQQRLKKKMKKQQEEEEEQQNALVRHGLEKQEALKLKEEEERKRLAEERKADKMKKKTEKEAKAKMIEEKAKLEVEKAVAEAAVEEKGADKKKARKPKKEKEAVVATKEEKTAKQLVYRPKTAAGPEGTSLVEALGATVQSAATEEKSGKPAKEKREPKAKEQKVYVEKKKESAPATSEAKASPKKAGGPEPVPEKVVDIKKAEVPVSKTVATEEKAATKKPEIKKEKPTKAAKAPKTPREPKAPVAEATAGKNTSSDNNLIASFVKQINSLQNLVLSKESEIGKLQKHIDKQEVRMEGIQSENGKLRDQLSITSNDSKMKQSVKELNEQLAKQVALNRLQASQILEFEEALWQSNKAKEEAEDSLYQSTAQVDAPAGPADATATSSEALTQAYQDLRSKTVEVRDMQQKVEAYQGKATAINGLSKTELSDLHDELSQSTFNVFVALGNLQKTK